jgi:hypothetical protein
MKLNMGTGKTCDLQSGVFKRAISWHVTICQALGFMETECSSPYTQEPDTCPYPEPDQSSLRPHTQPLENPF